MMELPLWFQRICSQSVSILGSFHLALMTENEDETMNGKQLDGHIEKPVSLVLDCFQHWFLSYKTWQRFDVDRVIPSIVVCIHLARHQK